MTLPGNDVTVAKTVLVLVRDGHAGDDMAEMYRLGRIWSIPGFDEKID